MWPPVAGAGEAAGAGGGGWHWGCFAESGTHGTERRGWTALPDTIISKHFNISQCNHPQSWTPHLATGENVPQDCVQNLRAKSVQISETLKLADITDRIWIFSFIIDTLYWDRQGATVMKYFYFSQL